jgi:hypothetical protein
MAKVVRCHFVILSVFKAVVAGHSLVSFHLVSSDTLLPTYVDNLLK